MNPAFYFMNAPETSDEEILEQLESDLEARQEPSALDEMVFKIAQAHQAGISLAQEHGQKALEAVIEKDAFVMPLLGMAAKQGLGAAAKGAINQIKPVGAGGFNFGKAAGVMTSLSGTATSLANKAKAFGGRGGTFGQKLVGGMMRNPNAPLYAAGLVGGAMFAPRDPQTGQKQYGKGMLMGAGLAGGAHALGAGEALRSAVISNKGPKILGEGGRRYALESYNATRQSAPMKAQWETGKLAPKPGVATAPAQAAPAAASHVPPAPVQAASSVQVDPKIYEEHAQLQAQQAEAMNNQRNLRQAMTSGNRGMVAQGPANRGVTPVVSGGVASGEFRTIHASANLSKIAASMMGQFDLSDTRRPGSPPPIPTPKPQTLGSINPKPLGASVGRVAPKPPPLPAMAKMRGLKLAGVMGRGWELLKGGKEIGFAAGRAGNHPPAIHREAARVKKVLKNTHPTSWRHPAYKQFSKTLDGLKEESIKSNVTRAAVGGGAVIGAGALRSRNRD